jgi:site-specific DNA-cytosine methylase
MINVGTDCSGLDAVHEALNQSGIDFVYEFACDICPVVRGLLAESNHPPRRIDDDVTTRDHRSVAAVDLYVAGFPCQSFSSLGSRKGLSDARGVIFRSVIAYIAERRPRVFVLENVPGLLVHDRGRTWATIRGALEALDGYVVDHRVLSPHEFGWPQSRHRVFIVGRRVNGTMAPFQWPERRAQLVELDSMLMTTARAARVCPSSVRAPPPGHARSIATFHSLAQSRGWELAKREHIVMLGQSVGRERIGTLGVCPCVTSRSDKFYLLRRRRYLCPQEALQIQGYSADHPASRLPAPKLKLLTGNSIHVGLMRLVLEPIMKHLLDRPRRKRARPM